MTKQDAHDAKAEMQEGGDGHTRPPEIEPPGDDVEAGSDDRFLIVGIGASAGGLASLEEFFRAVPVGTAMAFVVIQHLSPDHKSILSELLSRDTHMRVRQVEDTPHVEPGSVYVIPPGEELTIQDGTLHLQKRDGAGERHLPVDTFLRSLAHDRGEWAAGIILSGTGSDGTLGLRAIKEAGGLAIVQDPDTAQHDGMPRSAIATGLVDYVLPPAEMPGALRNYVDNFLLGTPLNRERTDTQDDRALDRVLAVLRTRTGHDFARYKPSTIGRRIQRRMTVRQIGSLRDYAAFLLHNRDEVDVLFREMLIGVTEFFRDPEAFELLGERVIPELIEAASHDAPLRVWVAACSTGEEAYSVAIVIQEKMEELGRQVPVQIFATDIDERAIHVARRGRYPASIAADVSPERLARFFEPADGGYVVAESVRSMIVFAHQSLVKDPPFSHVDLVTCRNFLIYLQPELQNSVIAVFEYALDPGGYLFLGTSEMLPEVAPYFELVDRKWKLFRRRDTRSRRLALPDLVDTRRAGVPVDAPALVPRQGHAREQIERSLLEHYRPPTLVVDAEGQILLAYGDVVRFLQPAPGEPGRWHVMQILRASLRVPVATGIHDAAFRAKTVRQTRVRLDDEATVDIVVRPAAHPASLEGLLFVEFHEPQAELTPEPVPEGEGGPTVDRRVKELERELQSTKEYLQAVIEETQSSNEELRSTNEELQSANEELATSQEEIRSVNEDLVSLNDALESRIDVSILFLDRRFHLQRFNPAATRIFNLIPGDVDRPATHLSSNLTKVDWVEDARRVFETLVPHAEHVRTEDGRWYQMRIHPYHTSDDTLDGVVLTFSDITELKEARRTARAAQTLAESIVETVREPLVILDEEMRVQSANRAFYSTFQVDPAETKNTLLYDLGNRQWDIPGLRKLLEEIIPENEVFEGFVVEHEFEQIGPRRMVLNARRVTTPGQPDLILLAIEEAGVQTHETP